MAPTYQVGRALREALSGRPIKVSVTFTMKTMKRLITLMQVLWTHTSAPVSTLHSQEGVASSARSYLDLIEKKILHEGKARTCEHFKMLHTCSIKIVTHDTLPEIPFCKVGKDGIPLELNPVKSLLLSSHREEQRIGLTITRFYEKIVLPERWDPTPITGEGPELSSSLLAEFSNFCKW